MTKRRELHLLIGALVTLVAGTASAGEMLLYGPGVPSPETASKAEAVLRASTDVEAPSGGTSHVIDLPFPAAGPLWIAGDLLPLPCGDATLAGVDPTSIVAQAMELVDELSYDKAKLKLDEGLRALPCVDTEFDRKTLADLYFFLGLAEFEKGNQDKAKRAFAAALAINIDRPWDDDYPPNPQAVYEEAATQLRAAVAPSVGLDLRGGSITDFRVDGEPVDVARAQTLSLHRGKHFIQYTDSDGARTSNLVDVGKGGGDFVTREALRDSVLHLAWKPIAAGAAESVLADLGRGRGVDDVYVVLLGDEDVASRAYRFSVSTAEVLPLAIGSRAVAAEAPPRKAPPAGAATSSADEAAGRVGLTVGGGLHVGNLHPYGLGTLRAHFRLVAGLELGVGAYVGVTSIAYTDASGADVEATYVLPGASFDVRYRGNLGGAHPYIGGRGILAASQLETTADAVAGTESGVSPAGGGGVLLGIDLTPLGAKGLVLNIDVTVGYWKLAGEGGGLLFDAGAGIGARF